MDGDGDLDIVVLTSDWIKLLLNAGDGMFGLPFDLPGEHDANIAALHLGDFDGDGDGMLHWLEPQAADWHLLCSLMNSALRAQWM